MSYTPFNKMKSELASKPGVTDPGGLAAFIARRKYGGAAVQKAAATGTSLKGKKSKHHAAVSKFVKRGM